MNGKEIRFVNLTPHEITIFSSDGKDVILKIPPSGKVTRVSMKQEKITEINGIPVYKTIYENVQDLPDPQPGIVYIVSILVLQALGGSRTDVVAPDTGTGAVRDSSGKIVGTKAFIVL